jgi:hypothetical protein
MVSAGYAAATNNGAAGQKQFKTGRKLELFLGVILLFTGNFHEHLTGVLNHGFTETQRLTDLSVRKYSSGLYLSARCGSRIRLN